MRQEQRFDRHEDNRQESFGRQEGFEARNNGGFDRDGSHGEAAQFGAFLGAHGTIAAQVSKDPSLLNNKEYMENHPELQEYLKAHPAAQAQLQQNPQAFMQSAQPEGAYGRQACTETTVAGQNNGRGEKKAPLVFFEKLFIVHAREAEVSNDREDGSGSGADTGNASPFGRGG
jgi:hypothetical protein